MTYGITPLRVPSRAQGSEFSRKARNTRWLCSLDESTVKKMLEDRRLPIIILYHSEHAWGSPIGEVHQLHTHTNIPCLVTAYGRSRH